jgi:hypothetical protein
VNIAKQHRTKPRVLQKTIQPNFKHPEQMNAQDLVVLQRTAGNQAVASLLGVQAKLEVGAVDDPLEREADRMAEQATAQPVRQSPAAVPQHPLAGRFAASSTLEREITAGQGSGQPLPGDLREEMEGRFGADFKGVRLHTGTDAARLSGQIGAKGFTRGQHIFMGQGRFDPGSGDGRKLLAHELAHTVQQGSGNGGAGGQGDVVRRNWLTDLLCGAGGPSRSDSGAAAPSRGGGFQQVDVNRPVDTGRFNDFLDVGARAESSSDADLPVAAAPASAQSGIAPMKPDLKPGPSWAPSIRSVAGSEPRATPLSAAAASSSSSSSAAPAPLSPAMGFAHSLRNRINQRGGDTPAQYTPPTKPAAAAAASPAADVEEPPDEAAVDPDSQPSAAAQAGPPESISGEEAVETASDFSMPDLKLEDRYAQNRKYFEQRS